VEAMELIDQIQSAVHTFEWDHWVKPSKIEFSRETFAHLGLSKRFLSHAAMFNASHESVFGIPFSVTDEVDGYRLIE
jgi:hypothetical protein